MKARFAVLALAALFPCLARAQVAHNPESFGTQDEGITVVGFDRFLPQGSSDEYDSSLEGRWTTAGRVMLRAPVTGIPDGATLTQVVFYFRDVSDVHPFWGLLERQWVDSGTGSDLGSDAPIQLASSGSPGDSWLSDQPNLQVRYRFDVDGDGTPEVVSYSLLAYTFGYDGDVQIREARLRWRRNVSPAPQAATFNDVPTSDPAFQFIEALAASGITVGCGGGNYCPDAPLTRRQMAVFLAKALGLHWPWNAP
jgi:hypothetical protein